MTYTQRFYSRKSIRLREYDYSQQGLYFITICTQNRACLFGSIEHSPNNDSTDTNSFNNNSSPINKSVMILNDAGKFANECWMEIPKHFPHVILHEFIIMPNHIHGIIELTSVGANNHSPYNHPQNNHSPNNDSPNNDSPNNHSPNNNSSNNHSLNNHSSNNHSSDTNSPNNDSPNNHSPNNHLSDNEHNAHECFGNNVNKINVNETNKWNENEPNNCFLNTANEWDIHETNKWDVNKTYVCDVNRENVCDVNRANNYSPLRGTSKTIGSVVRGFKIGVTKWMRQNTVVYDVWQRNYYEHIIRNEQSYLYNTPY